MIVSALVNGLVFYINVQQGVVEKEMLPLPPSITATKHPLWVARINWLMNGALPFPSHSLSLFFFVFIFVIMFSCSIAYRGWCADLYEVIFHALTRLMSHYLCKVLMPFSLVVFVFNSLPSNSNLPDNAKEEDANLILKV